MLSTNSTAASTMMAEYRTVGFVDVVLDETEAHDLLWLMMIRALGMMMMMIMMLVDLEREGYR